MTSKFKPTKRPELEAEVDDWDADSDTNDERGQDDQGAANGVETIIADTDRLALSGGSSSTASYSKPAAVLRDAWDDSEIKSTAGMAPPVKRGKEIWEEANRDPPAAEFQPILGSNRTLPTAVLPTRGALTSSSSPSSHQQPFGEYDYRPPPQILRRDPNARAHASTQSAQDGVRKKTLAEREEEYRKARERIFGNTKGADPASKKENGTRTRAKDSPGGASSGKANSKPNSRNGSGSDTGGRNSPAASNQPPSSLSNHVRQKR